MAVVVFLLINDAKEVSSIFAFKHNQIVCNELVLCGPIPHISHRTNKPTINEHTIAHNRLYCTHGQLGGTNYYENLFNWIN